MVSRAHRALPPVELGKDVPTRDQRSCSSPTHLHRAPCVCGDRAPNTHQAEHLEFGWDVQHGKDAANMPVMQTEHLQSVPKNSILWGFVVVLEGNWRKRLGFKFGIIRYKAS